MKKSTIFGLDTDKHEYKEILTKTQVKLVGYNARLSKNTAVIGLFCCVLPGMKK